MIDQDHLRSGRRALMNISANLGVVEVISQPMARALCEHLNDLERERGQAQAARERAREERARAERIEADCHGQLVAASNRVKNADDEKRSAMIDRVRADALLSRAERALGGDVEIEVERETLGAISAYLDYRDPTRIVAAPPAIEAR